MQYLLGTCVLSDFARGESSTVTRLKEIPPTDLAISTVTEMEIAYGLRLNPSSARRVRPIMDALLSAMVALPYDSASARATGELRAKLKREGRPIGAYDALIAGTALAQDLILVTSNLREFRRIPGLRIEDWRT